MTFNAKEERKKRERKKTRKQGEVKELVKKCTCEVVTGQQRRGANFVKPIKIHISCSSVGIITSYKAGRSFQCIIFLYMETRIIVVGIKNSSLK